MKKVLLAFSIFISATVAMASVVDWHLQFSEGTSLDQKWANATVYSYLTLIPDMSGTALDPETFMSTWTPPSPDSPFQDTDEVKSGSSFNYADENTGGVSGWQKGEGLFEGPFPGYLIIVLVNPDGETMYAFQGTDSATGDLLPFRDETTGNLHLVEFDENSNWTILGGDPVDPNVPEPTALALLALGVAGVALRRRIR